MNGDAPVSSPLDELWGVLAEADTEPIPAGMEGRLLASALGERPAGRPVAEVPPITPLAAFHAQVAAFDAVLGSLDDTDWRRPALRDLDVQGLVGHLIGVERDFQRALDVAGIAGAGDAQAAGDGVDHVASTQSAALAEAGRAPEDTRAAWRAEAERTLERLAFDGVAASPARIEMHGIALPLSDWLVVRAFELWTHEEDVRRVAGRSPAPPSTSAVRLMTDLAVALLPAGMGRVGPSAPAGVTRLVLTGPAGGSWSVRFGAADGQTSARIVADTIDFCRVAAARVQPERLEASITGDRDLAMLLLRGAFTLALD